MSLEYHKIFITSNQFLINKNKTKNSIGHTAHSISHSWRLVLLLKISLQAMIGHNSRDGIDVIEQEK